MVRKYDRYGLNRQFKRKPVSKRTPFPNKLPFLDDFSYSAIVGRVKSEQGIKRKREQSRGIKRKREREGNFDLPKPKYGKDSPARFFSDVAGAGAFSLAAVSGAAEAYEAIATVRASAAEAELVAARREAARFRVKGKAVDLANGGIKNAKALYRLARSQKPKFRFARFVIRQGYGVGKKYL